MVETEAQGGGSDGGSGFIGWSFCSGLAVLIPTLSLVFIAELRVARCCRVQLFAAVPGLGCSWGVDGGSAGSSAFGGYWKSDFVRAKLRHASLVSFWILPLFLMA